MYSVVTLELLDDIPDARSKAYNALLSGFGLGTKNHRKPWVARIKGIDDKYGFKREFVREKRDYSRSNSKGSRGIFLSFFLEHGEVYEVFSHVSWRSTDRYFCKPGPDGLSRLKKEEVVEWLKHRSE